MLEIIAGKESESYEQVTEFSIAMQNIQIIIKPGTHALSGRLLIRA